MKYINEKVFLYEMDKSLVVFQDKKIRRTWFKDEWWFVIKDIVEVLTDSKNPSDYLKKLRKRDITLNQFFKGGGQFVPPLVLNLKQLVEFKCFNVGIQKGFSD